MCDFSSDLEFNKLLSGGTDIDLTRLMLEFAADAYPDLDRLGCLLEVDRLGAACRDLLDKMPVRPDAQQQLATVSRLLYDIEGFHGNREAYYEPHNSYLNEVLSRRQGIPISLGILYMAVAARVGLRMFGVNTPGHFVVGCAGHGAAWYVDAFNNGDVLNRRACKRRVEEMVGQSGVVANEHFCPASVCHIAARVLRNLKASYAMDDQWNAALPVQRRLAVLLPDDPQEQRDLGLIYLRTGHPHEALPLLEGYRESCREDHAEILQASIRTARKLAAELN